MIMLVRKLILKEIVFLSQDHNQLDLTELNHNVSCLVWGSAYQAHIHYIWSSMATGGSSELPDAFDYPGHLFFFLFFFKKLCFSRPMVFKSQCTSESPEKNLCFVKTQIASFQESGSGGLGELMNYLLPPFSSLLLCWPFLFLDHLFRFKSIKAHFKSSFFYQVFNKKHH